MLLLFRRSKSGLAVFVRLVFAKTLVHVREHILTLIKTLYLPLQKLNRKMSTEAVSKCLEMDIERVCRQSRHVGATFADINRTNSIVFLWVFLWCYTIRRSHCWTELLHAMNNLSFIIKYVVNDMETSLWIYIRYYSIGLVSTEVVDVLLWKHREIIHLEILPVGKKKIAATKYCDNFSNQIAGIQGNRPFLENRKIVIFHYENAR